MCANDLGKVADQFSRPRRLLSADIGFWWWVSKLRCRKPNFSAKNLVSGIGSHARFRGFWCPFRPRESVKSWRCTNEKDAAWIDESNDTQRPGKPATWIRETGLQSFTLVWDAKIAQISDRRQKNGHNFPPDGPIFTNRTFLEMRDSGGHAHNKKPVLPKNSLSAGPNTHLGTFGGPCLNRHWRVHHSAGLKAPITHRCDVCNFKARASRDMTIHAARRRCWWPTKCFEYLLSLIHSTCSCNPLSCHFSWLVVWSKLCWTF